MKPAVCITGAAQGIGLACSQRFFDAGWDIYGVDLQYPVSTSLFTDFLQYDLSTESAPNAVAAFVDQTQALNALVNNAALQYIKPLLETTAADIRSIFAVNLLAPLLLVQQLFQKLERVRGAIVNVASVHAVATSEDIGAYAASKAALVSLTRTMALEFGPKGVRANALLPGAVDTAMLRAGLTRGHVDAGDEQQKLAQMASRHPLLRVGQPSDIANAALFLADGAQSQFMTGQTLVFDGGCLARLATE